MRHSLDDHEEDRDQEDGDGRRERHADDGHRADHHEDRAELTLRAVQCRVDERRAVLDLRLRELDDQDRVLSPSPERLEEGTETAQLIAARLAEIPKGVDRVVFQHVPHVAECLVWPQVRFDDELRNFLRVLHDLG